MNATKIAQKLNSDNPNDIVLGLNKLLQVSADHDLNYALGKDGQLVIDALVRLFDETIGWKHSNSEFNQVNGCLRNHDSSEGYNDEDDDYDLTDLIPSSKTWEYHASPSKVGANNINIVPWATFCATKFAPFSLNTAMTPSHIAPYNILSDTAAASFTDVDGNCNGNHNTAVVTNKEHMKRLEVIIMIIRNLSYGKYN